MRSVKLALALTAFAVLLSPVARANGPVAIPAPQYRIKPATAKRLVSQVATELHGRYGRGWTVTLAPPQFPNGPIGGSSLNFKATVNWGKGPHIMTATGGGAHTLIAVPDVTGTIYMGKAPGAPKGKARVTVLGPRLPL